jgi:hypothetical protein
MGNQLEELYEPGPVRGEQEEGPDPDLLLGWDRAVCLGALQVIVRGEASRSCMLPFLFLPSYFFIYSRRLQGYEVLLLNDPMDEILMSHLRDWKYVCLTRLCPDVSNLLLLGACSSRMLRRRVSSLVVSTTRLHSSPAMLNHLCDLCVR